MTCRWRGRHVYSPDPSSRHDCPPRDKRTFHVLCPVCRRVLRCGVLVSESGTYVLRVPSHPAR